MRKIFYIIFIAILIHITATKAIAEVPVADASATYRTEVKSGSEDSRAKVLEKFLKQHNSPLAEDAQDIVKIADEHNIPWTWIPAISGVESTFCKAIPYNSYNCWGWANGTYKFQNYEEAVSVISKSLKEKYVDRGADTIEKIAPIYAPPSTTWSGKVNYFIAKIENFDTVDTGNLSISL